MDQSLKMAIIQRSLKDKKNRSIEILMDLENTISWGRIELILLKDYKEGNRALPSMGGST